jgi:hypothetical protein
VDPSGTPAHFWFCEDDSFMVCSSGCFPDF